MEDEKTYSAGTWSSNTRDLWRRARAMAVDIPRLKCPGGGPRINQFYEQMREAENKGVKSPRGDCYLHQWQSVLRGDIEKGRN